MVTCPLGLGTKDHFAGESQRQFSTQSDSNGFNFANTSFLLALLTLVLGIALQVRCDFQQSSVLRPCRWRNGIFVDVNRKTGFVGTPAPTVYDRVMDG
jgi:hypothetical protein